MEFSKVQIKIMQDTLSNGFARDSIIWKTAFAYYNRNHKHWLSMQLHKAYPLVLAYVIANNSKETVNIEL